LSFRDIESDDEGDEETTLRNSVKLVGDLKETIVKQNTIIENNQAELVEIKEEQQALRVQNTKLQDEIRTLRGQPFNLTPLNTLFGVGGGWCQCDPVRNQPFPRLQVKMGSRKNQIACGSARKQDTKMPR
jgi:hypothetical protein